tara:strand:+ start:2947 stop:3747 length:801 start_codon:yes stop_codon:yes gene_type:complete
MGSTFFNNKWVWITGASSGIGKAVSEELAKRGANLILSARNESELQKVAVNCGVSGRVIVLPLDLSVPEQLVAAYDKLELENIAIDILINNGGMSQRGLVKDTDVSVHRKLLEVNYFGSVQLTALVLPNMLKRRKGHIVGVSSIVGQFGFPLRSSYSASKHALKGYLESLYLEENKNGIDVSIVYPGRINTEISKHALDKNGNPHDKMDEGLANGMDVNVCAKKIINGIEKKKIEIFVGKRELLLLFIRRYTPAIFFKIAKNIKPV